MKLFHPRHIERHLPAIFVRCCRCAPTAMNLINGQVAPTIVVFVTAVGKGVHQAKADVPEVVVVVCVGIVDRVFVDDVDVQPMLLFNGDSGDVEIIDIGLQHGQFIVTVGWDVTKGFAFLLWVVADIDDHLHYPEQAHLVICPPRAIGAALVEHVAAKGNPGIAIGIAFDGGWGQYFQRVGIGFEHAHAISVELALVDGVGKVGDGRSGCDGCGPGFDWQIAKAPGLLRDTHRDHRNNADVAIASIGIFAADGKVGGVGKGCVEIAANVALAVVRGPIQYIECRREMAGGFGAQLQVDIERLVGVQPVGTQGKG